MTNLRHVRRAVVCLALFVLSGLALSALAQTTHPADRFRAGLRNAPGARRLDAAQLELVLRSLREKTGWQTLAFDDAGFLVCPDPQTFDGGSAAARRLLGAALAGAATFELEAHPHSPEVKFARLTNGIEYSRHKQNQKIVTYHIQLDFADFRQLRGERAVLWAFDPGIGVLHELGHGVWQLQDAVTPTDEPGACERYINQMRRELGLPERQQYEARARRRGNDPRLVAELPFIRFREEHGQRKPRRFYLRWDAEMVGPVSEPGLTAAVR